jgi:myo-inositol 2-dehydrogenase/D-chiro-inositol 1-dehydrogenase
MVKFPIDGGDVMINACLIGAGRMGRDHAKHIILSQAAKLYAVVDIDLKVAKDLADRYGAKTFNTAEEALADPKVDAVVIVSNTDTHADLISLAARAGKPIFCEKPIDLNLSRIDACLKVVEEKKTPLFVAFNRRFDPSFQQLRQKLNEKSIGKIELVSISSRDLAMPEKRFLKTSGGLFRDMMIHDFDMARWLLGEEPTEVYAAGSCLVDPSIHEFGDLDTAMVILKTKSGALCHINNSRRSVYGYDQRIEVFGEKGMLRAQNLTPTTLEYSTVAGVTTDNPHPSFPQRYQEAYRLEMEHFFVDVVKGGKAPLISGADGRQAIVIAEAAQESYRTGLPVKISG